jgi:uncharacterized protein (DUF1499 family)
MRWLLVIGVLVGAVLVAGRLGAFAGRAPSKLGLAEGKLKPPSKTPNSVSSQADLWPDHPQREIARIAPLAFSGDAAAAWARLQQVVAAMPGARIVKSEGDYLYVQFSTRWLGFVDDAEFWLDRGAGVMQVRSSSRVGRRDFGVNRARVEALRARFASSQDKAS